ncbi:hypothetical protein ACXR2T_01395, partial [Leucobacter sp. HY1910]
RQKELRMMVLTRNIHRCSPDNNCASAGGAQPEYWRCSEVRILTEEPTVEAPAAKEPAEPKNSEAAPAEEWTTVATISGAADQQSDTLVLSGSKVRLTYDFVDTSGAGMIVGAIYVLPEGTDLMTDGGIPEVMVSDAGPGETLLRKKAGEYFLRISAANASYTVTVEELK